MLFKYILEIKTRVFLITISWLLTTMACYYHKETLLFLFIKSNVKLYCMGSFYFISTSLTEVFTVYLRLSYFVSTQFTVFILLYHCLMFVSPALFRTEYDILKQPVFICLGLFVTSILAFNTLLLPVIWSFFLSFMNYHGNSINVFFEAKIIEYFSFYTTTYFVVVLIGQLFGVVLFALNVVKNKHKFIIVTRKVFYVFFLLLSAAITPPDVFSLLVTVLCFVLLYECFILLVFFKSKYFVLDFKVIIISKWLYKKPMF
jgi:sec-independent protein translocase protein TatC